MANIAFQCVLLAQVAGASPGGAVETDRYGSPIADEQADRIGDDIRSTSPIGLPADDVPGDAGPLGGDPSGAVRSDTAPGDANPSGAIPSQTTPQRPRAGVERNPFGDALPASEAKRPPRSSAARGASRSLSAKQWLAELLAEPPGGALVGKPITLVEALKGVRAVKQQEAVIDAYWRLSRAVAGYYIAVQVDQVVAATANSGDSVGGRDTARSVAEMRLATAQAKLAAVEAQAELVDLITWSGDELPLPASKPHAGSYRTRYAEIFAGGSNRSALRLHFTLPVQKELIRAHAELLGTLASDLESGTAGAIAFRDQCGAFLDAIYEYNGSIAEYVLLAARAGSDGAQLVPMLIKVDRRPSDGPLLAKEPSRKLPVDSRPSGVVPASGTDDGPSGAERSVLVAPVDSANPAEETNLLPVDRSEAAPNTSLPPDARWRGRRE